MTDASIHTHRTTITSSLTKKLLGYVKDIFSKAISFFFKNIIGKALGYLQSILFFSLRRTDEWKALENEFIINNNIMCATRKSLILETCSQEELDEARKKKTQTKGEKLIHALLLLTPSSTLSNDDDIKNMRNWEDISSAYDCGINTDKNRVKDAFNKLIENFKETDLSQLRESLEKEFENGKLSKVCTQEYILDTIDLILRMECKKKGKDLEPKYFIYGVYHINTAIARLLKILQHVEYIYVPQAINYLKSGQNEEQIMLTRQLYNILEKN